MNIALIVLFALAAIFSLSIKMVLFHHFKKFSVPGDLLSTKVLLIFKVGSIILISISFVFLIILFI